MADSIRIPLVETIEPRLADSDKDGLASNIFYDKNTAGQIFATKRPGLANYIAGQGQAQGIFNSFGWQLNSVWTQVIWNGTKFCSVSKQGSDTGYQDLSITSTDGITWQQGFLPEVGTGYSTWVGVAWNGTVFCTTGTSGSTGKAATSTDGITWTTRTIQNVTWSSIAAGGTSFVTIGVGTTPSSYSSDNGITWTSGDLPTVSGRTPSIAYNAGAGLFCVVYRPSAGGVTTSSHTSPTGAIWTSRTIPSAARHTITSSATTFFSPRFNTNKGDISTDGINWTEVTLPAVRDWAVSTWTGSLFLVYATDTETDYVAYSSNGITWAEVVLPAPIFPSTIGNRYTTLAGNADIIVSLADGNSFAYSTDDSVSYSAGNLGRYYPYPFTSSL